jgi:hypothetical protein
LSSDSLSSLVSISFTSLTVSSCFSFLAITQIYKRGRLLTWSSLGFSCAVCFEVISLEKCKLFLLQQT